MIHIIIEVQGNSEQDETNAAGWLKDSLIRMRDKVGLWPHPDDARAFDEPFDVQLLTTSIRVKQVLP